MLSLAQPLFIGSVRISPGGDHDGHLRVAIFDSSPRAGEALDLNRRASSVLPNGSAGCLGALPVPKAVSDDPPRDVSFFETPGFHAGEVRVIRGLGVLCESHSRQKSGERKDRELHCDNCIVSVGLKMMDDLQHSS